MLLECIVKERFGRNRSHRKCLRLQCDHCDTQFESLKNVRRTLTGQQTLHFCSELCRRLALGSGKTRENLDVLFIERFGGRSPYADSCVRSKAVDTLRRVHGVEHNLSIPSAIAHRAVTWCEKYGVDHPMRSASVISKIDFSETWRKGHETMKRHGTYAKSCPEDRFYALLQSAFGGDDVVRQPMVNGWAIDFYIKPIDAYVQFDGVYWHGLDRSIEQIRESMNLRDCAIARKWDVDRIQDAWFTAHGARLVRITDVEFRMRGIDCLRALK